MNAQCRGQPQFVLGRILATPGALALLDRARVSGLEYLKRHVMGDFGTMGDEDVRANWEAIRTGSRVMSAYAVGDERLWIITEADRSATTFLLPDEY
jgi:hypothetical protein